MGASYAWLLSKDLSCDVNGSCNETYRQTCQYAEGPSLPTVVSVMRYSNSAVHVSPGNPIQQRYIRLPHYSVGNALFFTKVKQFSRLPLLNKKLQVPSSPQLTPKKPYLYNEFSLFQLLFSQALLETKLAPYSYNSSACCR